LVVSADTKAYSGLAVRYMPEARDVYDGTLGPSRCEEHGLLWLRLASGRDTLVYERSDATRRLLRVACASGATTALSRTGREIFLEGSPCIAWFTDPSSMCCRSSEGGGHEGARAAASLAHRLRAGR
jgi:hypothetical protein